MKKQGEGISICPILKKVYIRSKWFVNATIPKVNSKG